MPMELKGHQLPFQKPKGKSLRKATQVLIPLTQHYGAAAQKNTSNDSLEAIYLLRLELMDMKLAMNMSQPPQQPLTSTALLSMTSQNPTGVMSPGMPPGSTPMMNLPVFKPGTTIRIYPMCMQIIMVPPAMRHWNPSQYGMPRDCSLKQSPPRSHLYRIFCMNTISCSWQSQKPGIGIRKMLSWEFKATPCFAKI